ncbi:uncharacterized protein LOC133795225 [Humulus lupulus]|uniref:uncharacterized protein LOC133795225 n=1 Tax=Humulus lupulus TaxID=3486 RepID=UPI002B410DAF|nr:uncharacterized protein LOC133795225 [Humulus lupulus]
MDGGSSTRQGRKRAHIDRGHVEGHQRLFDEYFSDEPVYTEYQFRRRFRMRRHVFLRIVQALENHSEYFYMRFNAVGRRGLSPLQKCTAAMRMLAYGAPADYVDEYVRISETTAIECLVNFVWGVNDIFGTEYLRRPNAGDIRHLLQMGEMVSIQSGVHLLKLSHCLKERKENYLLDAKKQYTKMLSEHSEYFNLVFLLYEDQHVFWQRDVLKDIMYACIILHNIIVDDEINAYKSLFDFNYDDDSADTLMVEVLHKPISDFPTMLQRNA